MAGLKNPQPSESLTLILTRVNLFTAGVYGWEYVQAFHIEYALIRRRIVFRWPLIPYVLGRLCFMISVVIFVVTMIPECAELVSTVWATVCTVTSGIAIGCSSTNLMIRAWLIWKNSRVVLGSLLVVAIGHWTILILGMVILNGCGDKEGCVFERPRHVILATTFVYTMVYDLFVLVLTVAGLPQKPPAPTAGILRRLRRQGLTYCAIVLFANTLPMIFAWLNLDVTMDIFFTIPAICTSVITSSRAVLSLLGLKSSISSEKAEEDIMFTTRIGMPQTGTLPHSLA